MLMQYGGVQSPASRRAWAGGRPKDRTVAETVVSGCEASLAGGELLTCWLKPKSRWWTPRIIREWSGASR